jgi:mannose-6-phosphate isomerase-like protein (cupin superfamily)
MANRTGYSSAILSQIENHMVSPPLGALIKLAKALEVKVGTFFGDEPREPYTIVRKDERRNISRFASKEGVNYGYSYESLGFDKKDRHMEPFLVSLEPATVKSEKLSTHDGEEFIFILEGEMEAMLGTHKDILYPGDCIYYDSTIPHKVQCHGDIATKILAVIWTPQ